MHDGMSFWFENLNLIQWFDITPQALIMTFPLVEALGEGAWLDKAVILQNDVF